jgi:Ca-activated chloride channel family protein
VRVEGSLTPGQTLTIQPVPDATTIRVIRPDGAITTFNVDQPLVVYADTPMSGIYTVDVYKGSDLAQEEFFAVNLFDPNESDIATRTPTIGGGAVTAAAQQEIGQQEFWPWIALVALVVLVFEWFVYHRRLQAPRLRVGGDQRFARSGKKP